MLFHLETKFQPNNNDNATLSEQHGAPELILRDFPHQIDLSLSAAGLRRLLHSCWSIFPSFPLSSLWEGVTEISAAAAMATIMDPNGTNFIVNNTLYFIYGSLKFDTEANVTRKCESFYAIEDIVKAKKDLFDAVQSFKCMSGVKNINRQTHNDTGARKVVEDIIFVLKKCDNEGEQLPLFYSSDFCDIPRLDAPDSLVSKIDAVMSTILWMQKNFVTQEMLEKTIVKLSTSAAAAPTSFT